MRLESDSTVLNDDGVKVSAPHLTIAIMGQKKDVALIEKDSSKVNCADQEI